VAGGVQGGFFPVDEVVVEGDGQGFEAIDSELGGETACEGGFAGGGGAGNEHDLDGAVMVSYGVGNSGDFFFVKGFGQGDEFVEAAFIYVGVDAVKLGDVQMAEPISGFGVGGGKVGGRDEEDVLVGGAGQIEDEACPEGDEAKVFDAGGGGQGGVDGLEGRGIEPV